MGDILIVEWVQLGAAAAGIIVCIYALVLTRRDLARLRKRLRPTSMVDDAVGRIRRRREGMRLMKHLGLLLGGWIITDWRLKHWDTIQSYTGGAITISVLLSYYTARYTFTYISLMTFIETLWERYDRWFIAQLSDVEYDSWRSSHTRRHDSDERRDGSDGD
jgi:hypothetical protein